MLACVVTQVLFILLLAASLAFFARTIWLFGRAVCGRRRPIRGRASTSSPGALLDVGIYFFGQKKVAEEGPQHRTSKHHLFIFWGFLIITIATVDILVVGRRPRRVAARCCPRVIYQPLYALIDVMNLIVLLMIAWAIIRRTIVKPRLIPMNLDAGLILGAIGSLMVTHFLFHGYEVAARSPPATARRLPADLEHRSAAGSRRCRPTPRPRPDDRLLAARPDPADVPQLPALLQAHPPARRAAEHLRRATAASAGWICRS